MGRLRLDYGSKTFFGEKMKLSKMLMLMLSTPIFLAGCGPSFDELGFTSEEEARHLNEMGYPTFDALLTRGRFTTVEQAREAVDAGFYELSAYENYVYTEYRKGGYSLVEVLELQAEFTNKELSEALILEAMGTITANNPAKFDPSLGTLVGTASSADCDAMNRALESLNEQTKAAFSMTVATTCRNVPTLAEEKERQLALRESFTSPDWQPTEKMPEEWGRLQGRGDCGFSGPEAYAFFEYADPEEGRQYLFTNITPPPGVSSGTTRYAAVVDTKKVWVSSKNPNLYLSFDDLRRFSIDLVEGDSTFGQHKTLDGQPWNSFENVGTKYNAADYRRWAVDTGRSEPYQSSGAYQMCPPESYAHWLDVRFELKKGAASIGTATLGQIIR